MNARIGGLIGAFVIFVCLASARAQSGGGFDLTWNTFDGGGAMFSTAGPFELGGTIGQPDASVSVMTGGAFALTGGFWFPQILCQSTPQDADGDGDVDLLDFGVFQTCFNGPNRPYAAAGNPEACLCFDNNEDGDVDLLDFGPFQTCFNGPNRTPRCP
jgi:hypothetical protein